MTHSAPPPLSYRRRIELQLTRHLAPTRLEIEDESHRHAGHAGHRAEGETHFRILVVSPAFDGLGRVQRQRLVYEALRQELAERVHALAMTTLTPAEAANAGR